MRTENFQLAYRVMHLLRERKVNVEQRSIDETLPHRDSIWIGTPQEVAFRQHEGRPIAAQLESIDEMIEEAIFALRSPKQTHRLIIGIDTGPRPGLAWLADGVLIDTIQTESIDECLVRIDALLQHQSFQHLLFKLGNGSPSHRDRLVNALLIKNHSVELVKENKPAQVTLVPDGPEAITSNAGWDVKNNFKLLSEVIKEFQNEGIRVSIFVDPTLEQIEWVKKAGADRVELYTEQFAHEFSKGNLDSILPYKEAAVFAKDIDLGVNAGHDLSLENLNYFAKEIPELDEVSIGHALISDALYLGLENTIQLYRRALNTDNGIEF